MMGGLWAASKAHGRVWKLVVQSDSPLVVVMAELMADSMAKSMDGPMAEKMVDEMAGESAGPRDALSVGLKAASKDSQMATASVGD